MLDPTDLSQWVPCSPGSFPAPTRVAAHGKRAESLKPFRETFRRIYIVERTNKAEIRLENRVRKRKIVRRIYGMKYS